MRIAPYIDGGLHGKNLANKKYVSAGTSRNEPHTGEFINNGQCLERRLGTRARVRARQEGVLTAYYGNPRQIMFTVGQA